MYGDVPLKNTVSVVADCVAGAETGVRSRIRDSFPDATEEEITAVFQEALHCALLKASGDRAISSAFARDLIAAHIGMQAHKASEAASGLVAAVSWHGRHTEGRTGGDFGLLLVRPRVQWANMHDKLVISSGCSSGILVQAKKKQFGKAWGMFTEPQEQVLPARLDYLSLCLYRLTDPENRQLAPFEWTICKGRTLTEIQAWLKADNFPDKNSSAEIVKYLGAGRVGTDNRDAINNVVAPLGSRTLIIKIDWEGGVPPRSTIEVGRRCQQQQVRHQL